MVVVVLYPAWIRVTSHEQLWYLCTCGDMLPKLASSSITCWRMLLIFCTSAALGTVVVIMPLPGALLFLAETVPGGGAADVWCLGTAAAALPAAAAAALPVGGNDADFAVLLFFRCGPPSLRSSVIRLIWGSCDGGSICELLLLYFICSWLKSAGPVPPD